MKKYIFLLLLPLLFSCSEEAEPVYMKCGTVEYVDEFPKTLDMFKWDGTPVLKIRIPFMASSFGISDTGDIYIFDNYGKYEKLYLYKNINDIV